MTHLDKIKHLIALSTDTSTTESERQLAMKRATELMAKYSLSLTDDSAESIVDVEVPHGRLPSYVSQLNFCSICSVVGQNFGCYAYANIREGKQYLMGFKTNCEIAIYTIDTLVNQGVADCRLGSVTNNTLGFKLNFWNGFTLGLKDKFVKPQLDEYALVLYDKVKHQFQSKITRFVANPLSGSNTSGFSSGQQSARDAHTNKGVASQGGRLLT